VGRLEKKMIKEAVRKHRRIYPCADKKALEECFTRHENRLLFWFNTEEKTTHVVAANHPRKVKR